MRFGVRLGLLALVVLCCGAPRPARAQPSTAPSSEAPSSEASSRQAPPNEETSPRPAAAGIPPAVATLDYERGAGAEGCIGPEPLARAVEQRLERPIFGGRERAAIVAHLRAERVGDAFVFRLRLSDRRGRVLGSRELSTVAEDCSALDDSLALVLSLALDVPTREAASAPPEPEPAEPPPAAPPPAPPEPHERWQVAPALGAVLGLGVLPRAALDVSARVELAPPGVWWLGAGVTRFGEQRLGDGQGGRFDALTVQFWACPLTFSLRASLSAGLCPELLLAYQGSEGFGFGRSYEGDRWLPALGARGSLRQELGPVFVSATVSLLAPLIHRRYFYEQGGEITFHEAAVAQLVGGLFVGVAL